MIEACYNTLMIKKKSSPQSVPYKYKVVGFVSLMLNAVLLGIIGVGAVLETNGSLDYATINSSITRMCSDQFRDTVKKDSVAAGDSKNDQGLRLALVDYPCKNNGAQEFYEKGYKEYISTLGLKLQ